MEKHNYGAPPEDSGIARNPEVISRDEPQAFCKKIINKKEWVYNFLWATLLAEKLNKKLPTFGQIHVAVRQTPRYFLQYAGYLEGSTGDWYGQAYVSYFWTTKDPLGSPEERCALYFSDNVVTSRYFDYGDYMSVRFIDEEKGPTLWI